MFHHGMSDTTTGSMLNPTPDVFPNGVWNASTNPLGVVPGTSVSYNMATDLIMVGVSYTFNK